MKFAARNAFALVPELLDYESCGFEPLRVFDSLSGGEPRAPQYTGIKALMRAVLEDGIRSYLGRNARLRTEAAYWISSNSRRSPFAFGIVCETLGLEPGAVRVALERLRNANVPARTALGRTRPNVRHNGRLATSRAS